MIKLKKFLRPTKTKIFLFVIFIIITLIFTCLGVFSISCIAGCEKLSEEYWNCTICPICNYNKTILFSLIFITPNYFLSCLLVYIGNKINLLVNKR